MEHEKASKKKRNTKSKEQWNSVSKDVTNRSKWKLRSFNKFGN